jgi:hypothetical protein
MLEVSNCSPEMAVPMTVKMPEPMTAPMPSAVSDQGPRVFLSARSGSSDSRISLSMDLQASSWLGSAVLLVDRMRHLPAEELSCRLVRKPYGESVHDDGEAAARGAHRSGRMVLKGAERQESGGAGVDAGPEAECRTALSASTGRASAS